MKIPSIFFSVAKEGNLDSENEDKLYPQKNYLEGPQISFALSDGATEGMFSSSWAECLVKNYVDLHEAKKPNDFFLKTYSAFETWKKDYLKQRETENRPLKWYELANFEKGAYATFLGVTFYDDAKYGKIWKSHSIGDTCLFQLRNHRLLHCFPIRNSNKFDNSPILISSNKSQYNYTRKYIRKRTQYFENNDDFYLMTDALSKWFLVEVEKDNDPWKLLELFNECDQNEFMIFINELRIKKQIKNDDSTLLHLKITCD